MACNLTGTEHCQPFDAAACALSNSTCVWQDGCCEERPAELAALHAMEALVLPALVITVMNLALIGISAGMENFSKRAQLLLANGATAEGVVQDVDELAIMEMMPGEDDDRTYKSGSRYFVSYRFELEDSRSTVQVANQEFTAGSAWSGDPDASAALYTSLVQKKEAAPRIWPVTVLYNADDPTVCALQEACEMEAKLKIAKVKGLVFTAVGCLIGVFSLMAFEASLALEQEVLGASCVGLVVVATLGGCCCRRSVAKNCKWAGAPLRGHDISGGTRRCCGCGGADIGQERIWLEMSDDDSVENPMRK